MKLNTQMVCKEPVLDPVGYEVVAVEVLLGYEFQNLLGNLLVDNEMVKRHNPELSVAARQGKRAALLILNTENDDGLLVDSQGYDYCRYASYLPGIRPAIEQEIRMAVVGLMEHLCDTTNDPNCFVPWEKLNEKLGFALPVDSDLVYAVDDGLNEAENVLQWTMIKTGIGLELEPNACVAWQVEPEQDQQPQM